MLANKIAIIYRGRILISGTMDELKRELLGPAEYEVRLQGKWPHGSLRLPSGVTPLPDWHFRSPLSRRKSPGL